MVWEKLKNHERGMKQTSKPQVRHGTNQQIMGMVWDKSTNLERDMGQNNKPRAWYANGSAHISQE